MAKIGGFKNFLANEEALKKQKKKELAGLKKRLEQGSFMSSPSREKKTTESSQGALLCVSTTCQGWRVSNEDAQSVLLQLPSHPDTAYFGVFDGHGGTSVSKFLSTRLHEILDKQLPGNVKEAAPDDICEAIKGAFKQIDADAKSHLPTEQTSTTGSTCNTLVITDSHIFCGNAGDSRAVLCSGDKVVDLSHDHDPSSPRERARIEAAGSTVSDEMRIDGVLNVSRAMGDFDFKKGGGGPDTHAVSCAADMRVVARQAEDRFIVQACDGVWGCKSSEDVVAFVKEKVAAGEPPRQIVESLCDSCISDTLDDPGTDNISINLIIFR